MESILQALNQDALEEVAAHCSVGTLLNLQQTCASFARLLATSERVWCRKLAEDFGLHLKARKPPHVAGEGLISPAAPLPLGLAASEPA